jgi:hypothetical protein
MIGKPQSGPSERRWGERRRASDRRRGRRGRVWAPEGLEDRVLLSGLTYTVDQLTDTGAGSGTTGDLRYAITQADANASSRACIGHGSSPPAGRPLGGRVDTCV